MKNLLFSLMLFQIALYAQSFLISNIPLPKTYIQNLDPYECDEECMQEYLDKNMIFSFLAHANSKLDNKQQEEARMINISILNIGSNIITTNIKIALLLPYNIIGKYASSTTNSAFAYLMTKSNSFELKSYKIDNESENNISSAITKIKNDGFKYVIAPLTKNGADTVININPDINIYFPTINKKDVNTSSKYLSFGGIDYRKQNNLLLKHAVSPLVIFSDRSSTGMTLAKYQSNRFKNPPLEDNDVNISKNNFGIFIDEKNLNVDDNKTVIKYTISSRRTNLERYLKDNEKIQKGSFLINTPVVKTGMIISQLTLYDANATNVLSTQINYNPLLLSMTQYIDRKNMIIANSITKNNSVLTESNSLLGNDIVYDWINYTTTIGVDYFFHLMTNADREYNLPIKNNQVIYPIELMKSSISRFTKMQIPN